jgi:peptidoglycan/xylan/chitin deacetylase (PgdA/CDA1 family)
MNYSIPFLFLLVLLGVFTSCTPDNSVASRGVVTFAFDDGTLDHYTTAYPLFENYDASATTFIITNRSTFENETLLTWSQIHELSAAGWDVQSHSVSHSFLTTLSEDAVLFELAHSKKVLEAQGFVVNAFAPPYGDMDESVHQQILRHYAIVRPSEYGFNNRSVIDFTRIKSIWIVNTSSIDELTSFVDEAYEHDYWLVFMIHLVKEDLSKEYTIHPDTLDALLSYVREKNMPIQTIAEVYDEKN